MGALLPLISVMKSRLEDIISPKDLTTGKTDFVSRYRLTFRAQLAKWVLEHVDRRFSGVVNDSLNQQAAAMHPACKLTWATDLDVRQTLQQELETEVQLLVDDDSGDPTSDSPSCTTDSPGSTMEDLLYSAWDSQPVSSQSQGGNQAQRKAVDGLRTYLSCPRTRGEITTAIFPHRAVKDLFLKLNTRMPSSAAAERLFSAGRRVTHYLRGRLNDESIEASIVVATNRGRLDYKPRT